MTKQPKLLMCPNGHTVSVQDWGNPPLACPACVYGIPCNQPLTAVKRTRGERVPELETL